MSELFNYIAKNKEWIFSGIGVSATAAVIYLLRSYLNRKSQESHSSKAIEATQELSTTYRRRPYPAEIIKQIDNLPILQRDVVAEQYIGLRVEWETTLESAHSTSGNKVHLMLLDRGSYPWIYCDGDLSKHSEMKIANKGHKLWVQGQIAAIKGNGITLTDPIIRLV